MGLPFWEMPDALVIDGRRCPIDTDFRVGIRIRQMLWEPYYQTHPTALLDGICRLLFLREGSVTALDGTALLGAVVWYLLDGRAEPKRLLRQLGGTQDTAETAVSRMRAAAEDPVFSYLWDMPALYAAFMQVYRIDLLHEHMHLWQFDALFEALPADCPLSRTIALRASPLQSAEDGEARAALAAQKLLYKIPDTATLHRLHRQCDAGQADIC